MTPLPFNTMSLNFFKQALPKSTTLYKELTGNVTFTVAKEILVFLPKITESSVIHDNGCGTGAVTRAVMATPKIPKSIYATDKDAQTVSEFKATAAQYRWPVVVEVMSSEALSIPDNMFTHSIANFLIHLSPNDAQIASHVYRTLQAGGTALFTIWKDPMLVRAVQATLDVVQPGKPYSPSIERGWFNAMHLKQVLENAGFKPSNVQFKSVTAALKIDDFHRWAEIAWSFLGLSGDGWATNDENSWESVLRTFEQALDSSEQLEHVNGGAILRMPVDVAIAVK